MPVMATKQRTEPVAATSITQIPLPKYGGGWEWGPARAQTMSSVLIKLQVWDPGTTTGDFKTPNRHSWDKMVIGPPMGAHSPICYPGNVLVRGDIRLQPGMSLSSNYPPTSSAYITERRGQVRELALNKLYDKLRGDLDLSIDAFQRKQTWGTLKALRSVKGYLKKFAKQRWSQSWLEFQYGLRPLCSTIYGTIDKTINSQPGVFVISAREVMGGGPTKGSGWDGTYTFRHEFLARVQIKSNWWNFATWASLNPASWAYEMIPYSFVLDWFVKIGSFLRNAETAFLAHMALDISGYETATYQGEGLGRYQGSTTNFVNFWIHRGKHRNKMASIPWPKFPDVNLKLGWQRMLSAGSLLREFLVRKKALGG